MLERPRAVQSIGNGASVLYFLASYLFWQNEILSLIGFLWILWWSFELQLEMILLSRLWPLFEGAAGAFVNMFWILCAY